MNCSSLLFIKFHLICAWLFTFSSWTQYFQENNFQFENGTNQCIFFRLHPKLLVYCCLRNVVPCALWFLWCNFCSLSFMRNSRRVVGYFCGATYVACYFCKRCPVHWMIFVTQLLWPVIFAKLPCVTFPAQFLRPVISSQVAPCGGCFWKATFVACHFSEICSVWWGIFAAQHITPPRMDRISRQNLRSWKQHFWLKNDGEKWSRIFYFEIPLAPSELLLPSANKSAQKGWIGLVG